MVWALLRSGRPVMQAGTVLMILLVPGIICCRLVQQCSGETVVNIHSNRQQTNQVLLAHKIVQRHRLVIRHRRQPRAVFPERHTPYLRPMQDGFQLPRQRPAWRYNLLAAQRAAHRAPWNDSHGAGTPVAVHPSMLQRGTAGRPPASQLLMDATQQRGKQLRNGQNVSRRRTWSLCSAMVWARVRDCRSNSRTLESLEPVTKALPSGCTSTLSTHDSCPAAASRHTDRKSNPDNQPPQNPVGLLAIVEGTMQMYPSKHICTAGRAVQSGQTARAGAEVACNGGDSLSVLLCLRRT